jgi:superfamily II RNA helicase
MQYCILDEIHCMSGDHGSEFWERIMLLMNCPMIGLSATVNNGQQVQRWIEAMEKRRAELFQRDEASTVCFISHHERPADLNKYLYVNQQLYPLHPVSLLNAKQLMNRGIPDDFSLSPCETYRLDQAMHIDRQQPQLTSYFAPNWIIERAQFNTYAGHVKEKLIDLIAQKDTNKIDSISKVLDPTTTNAIEYPELKPMVSFIGEFITTLKEKNLLPCIVFTDSRPLCEELAERVASYLEQLESKLRRTKYRSQIEALEERLAHFDKLQKKRKAKKANKTSSKRAGDDGESGGNRDNDDKPAELQQMDEEDQNQLHLSGYEQEILNGILEEGTLANRRTCDRDLVDRLIERATSAHPRLTRYLKRGVAYHHPQLNNKGRLAVEGLFRNRYIQVIFSTWTLGTLTRFRTI